MERKFLKFYTDSLNSGAGQLFLRSQIVNDCSSITPKVSLSQQLNSAAATDKM